MKKSRFFPFERNRYFYGKLLTVRDFESEQKYFNDKRRLLNRLLFGSGVVAGLQVVAVDDKSVSVQSGLALDGLGREITVSSPVTLKLSMMEGFNNNDYAKNVYLCIAYDEKGKEPVHAVVNSSARPDEISEYNRVVEGYRLFIRENAPEPAQFEWNEFALATAVLYDDGHVRVLQTVPRYVTEGETFEARLRVEKTLQTPPITFEYEPLGGLFPLAEDPGCSTAGKIRIDVPADNKSDDFVVQWPVRAAGSAGDKGDFGSKPGTAVLTIGDRRIQVESACSQTIEIVADTEEKLWEAYAARSMDEALGSPAEPEVVLAKISLLQMGPSYVIDHVTPLPFNELIASSPLLGILARRTGSSLPGGGSDRAAFTAGASVRQLEADEPPQFSVDYRADKGHFDFTLGLPQQRSAQDEISSGVVDLPLAGGIVKSGMISFGKQERSYYTDEISHGLGPGQVMVTVGLEVADNDMIPDLLNVNESVFYGASDVFQGSDYDIGLPKVSVGTVVYPRRGTFRIGLKLLSPAEGASLRLRWWAVRSSKDTAQQAAATDLSFSEREAAAGTDSK
ncbi:hypothetical protein [Paenibacillus elgii]|uniref:hypothetical protein n=1 Tax=Paenibacillus elgii TaxID=189691 RepID=UPI000FD9C6B9|nr:hypothetical protein [Paenibacillus elgii]NEN85219.1 hypothetical protein [Paenibacillus elgii]